MLFQTYGDRRNPAVLFFHAMGVTGLSSEPIARYLQDRYFCILPTSTVYCEEQKYVSKLDEIRQVEDFLHRQGVETLAMVVASSIGADLAMAFLTQTKLPVEHAFFDGGQFAQIGKGTRRIMTPFLYFAIKSLYWSKGGTLKKILWCDDDSIKSYFIAAGKNLTYTNLRRQISDSLEDKPFPPLSKELQKHTYFEFGSIEDHFKYRQAVMEAYIDEIYLFFAGSSMGGAGDNVSKYSAEFLYKCWKRFRKYYATLTGITQNVEECLRSDTARMMFANSEFLLMFNQAPNDREVLAHILNASSAQMSYVSDKPPGHGLIKVGGAIVPLVNEFPKDTSLYWLMTTKPGEG